MIIQSKYLSIQDYHSSAPRWLSKSSILDFKKHGPQWWQLRYLLGIIKPEKPTEAMEQGNALDCYLTESEEIFYMRYVIKPEGHDGRTKEGKAWKEEHKDRKVISKEDHTILLEAVEAVKMHPMWTLISGSEKQLTLRRNTNLAFGLQSRPDFICVGTEPGHKVYIDLKKTCNLETFGRDAINFGYHYQAALASFCAADDGITFEKYYLAACEWERGSRFRLFEIPATAIEYAQRELVKIANEISDRIKADNFEDIQSEPEPLEIPAYLARKMDQ